MATATGSHSVTSADFKFGRIHWYPGGSANDGALDEIRLGTTFASVTPVAVEVENLFDAWRASEFTPEEMEDEQISGPLADPDDSGIKNLMRYALGLGRSELYADRMPTGEMAEHVFFQHVRLINPDGILYIVSMAAMRPY